MRPFWHILAIRPQIKFRKLPSNPAPTLLFLEKYFEVVFYDKTALYFCS